MIQPLPLSKKAKNSTTYDQRELRRVLSFQSFVHDTHTHTHTHTQLETHSYRVSIETYMKNLLYSLFLYKEFLTYLLS